MPKESRRGRNYWISEGKTAGGVKEKKIAGKQESWRAYCDISSGFRRRAARRKGICPFRFEYEQRALTTGNSQAGTFFCNVSFTLKMVKFQ